VFIGYSARDPDLFPLIRSIIAGASRVAWIDVPEWLDLPEGKRRHFESTRGPDARLREDLATPESGASPRSTRAAIENMPEGCIAVVDAMGVTHAGIFGDIPCARMKKRNVKALEARTWGTAAAVAAAILGGIHIVRVHDVAETAQVARVTDAVANPALRPIGPPSQ
jgi:hypothetical protein